jgi:hypothetical protein
LWERKSEEKEENLAVLKTNLCGIGIKLNEELIHGNAYQIHPFV